MRKICIIVIVFFLSACSKIDLGFKFADTFLWWKITDLIEFSGDHKDAAKKLFQNYYVQIVKDGREDFIKILQRFKSDLKLEIANQASREVIIRSVQKNRQILYQFVDLIGESEYQSLLKNYSDKIKKEKKSLADINDLQEKLSDRYNDIFSFFLGSPIACQNELINQFFKKNIYPFEEDFNNKDIYLQALKDTQGDRDKLKKLIDQFLVFEPLIAQVEFVQKKKNYFINLRQMTQASIDCASEKQIQKMKSRLDDIIEHLQNDFN